MKAVGICGSPRVEGNTEYLVKLCLNRLAEKGIETTFIPLAGKLIKPCIACYTCFKTKDKTCSQKDDDFHPIFTKMLEADIIVVGSPVYFGSATPEMMALLDRAGFVSRSNELLFTRKLGGPIAVARRSGHNFTFAQLLIWYMINGFVVPGSSYWNIAFGGKKGEVATDEEGVKTILNFADNLAWLAEKLG